LNLPHTPAQLVPLNSSSIRKSTNSCSPGFEGMLRRTVLRGTRSVVPVVTYILCRYEKCGCADSWFWVPIALLRVVSGPRPVWPSRLQTCRLEEVLQHSPGRPHPHRRNHPQRQRGFLAGIQLPNHAARSDRSVPDGTPVGAPRLLDRNPQHAHRGNRLVLNGPVTARPRCKSGGRACGETSVLPPRPESLRFFLPGDSPRATRR
jgi:hypothetical protein